MSIMNKRLQVEMSDGSLWQVPVIEIAKHRAYYFSKVDSDFERSYDKSFQYDTLPLFEEDEREIVDWAENNMNWEDVKDIAVKVEDSEVDYHWGWVNGDKFIVEVEE